MGRRNLHSREQQAEMAIAAAELLIVREGLAGLSMRKVATAIGYTVGQLYLIFKNQDALLLAINERTAAEVHATLQTAIDNDETAPSSVHALARAYLDYAWKHPKRWALMFDHRLPEDAETPLELNRRVQSIFKLVETALAPALPDLTGAVLRRYSTALWSGVHGICVLAIGQKLQLGGIKDHALLCDLLVERFVGDGLIAAPQSR